VSRRWRGTRAINSARRCFKDSTSEAADQAPGRKQSNAQMHRLRTTPATETGTIATARAIARYAPITKSKVSGCRRATSGTKVLAARVKELKKAAPCRATTTSNFCFYILSMCSSEPGS
jgi:hypothetical protein